MPAQSHSVRPWYSTFSSRSYPAGEVHCIALTTRPLISSCAATQECFRFNSSTLGLLRILKARGSYAHCSNMQHYQEHLWQLWGVQLEGIGARSMQHNLVTNSVRHPKCSCLGPA